MYGQDKKRCRERNKKKLEGEWRKREVVKEEAGGIIMERRERGEKR